MESNLGDLWVDICASAGIRHDGLSAASVLENRGRLERSSSHGGALPSGSSSSIESSSSTNLIDVAAGAIPRLEDGEVRAMLQDAEVRAVLRKVTMNEGVWNMAIHGLGGGEKAFEILVWYTMVWVKKQMDIKSSSQQVPPPPSPAWSFSCAQDVFQPSSSDAFQIFSDILQPPPTTQLLDQETRYTHQRLKSRKLMTGEPEMGDGLGSFDARFCRRSFISMPEGCKPEVMIPVKMAPCIYQQQTAVPSAQPTPAMATEAARRHRMTRQRQSCHAQAASPVATSCATAGGGSLWNTKTAAPPAVASSGMSEAQTPPPRTHVTAAWESRSMEYLTFVLQKELRPSDVSHLGRIILPKKDAELRMPPLETREGVSIEMVDFNSGQAWNLRYRFWPNNKSRMYILEKTAAFVMFHGLVEGDLLVIYRVLQGGYVLRGVKKKNGRLDIEPVQEDFAYSLAKGSLEGPPSLPESGTLDQRPYGCCPSDKSVKEEPVNLDDDPFLDEVILSMNPSDSSCIQTLEWFPSSTLDFPI